jgi:hypothetical protein
VYNRIIPTLLILTGGDPDALKGLQGAQNTASDPSTKLSLLRALDFNRHSTRGQGADFLEKSTVHTWEHSATTCKDNIPIQISPYMDFTFQNTLVTQLVDTLDLAR